MTASNAPSPRGQTIYQRWFVPSILILFILVFDQVTKLWIIQTLGPLPMSRSIVLIDDWLRFVYVQNTGIAFGLFRDLSSLFTVTSLAIAAGVIYTYMFHLPSHNMWVKISIGLILGGALGNVIDRIRLSYVVDFISVGWFPTFNVADSGVSIGVGILAFYLLLADEIEPRRVSSEDTALLQELLRRDVRSRD